jgi:hypothetical protein
MGRDASKVVGRPESIAIARSGRRAIVPAREKLSLRADD